MHATLSCILLWQSQSNQAYALSICSDKIIFVQDKMKIVLDKIIFVQDKKFCPKLKSHFSYNSSLMMNFLSMYKIFCSGQKIFCLRQFWFCPGQKSFCLDRWIGHKWSFPTRHLHGITWQIKVNICIYFHLW